jgi:hypothetical protein
MKECGIKFIDKSEAVWNMTIFSKALKSGWHSPNSAFHLMTVLFKPLYLHAILCTAIGSAKLQRI